MTPTPEEQINVFQTRIDNLTNSDWKDLHSPAMDYVDWDKDKELFVIRNEDYTIQKMSLMPLTSHLKQLFPNMEVLWKLAIKGWKIAEALDSYDIDIIPKNSFDTNENDILIFWHLYLTNEYEHRKLPNNACWDLYQYLRTTFKKNLLQTFAKS